MELAFKVSRYGFRVRFVLAPGRRIDCQDKTLTLETTEGHIFEIEAVEGVSLTETGNLSIISRGYDNEKSARLIGQRVKDALLLASASIFLGADMGREKALSWYNPEISDRIREKHGAQHINDVHGLAVFSTELPIVVGYASDVSLIANFTAGQLQKSFRQNYNIADSLTDRQKLAAELINLIHFEWSLRARFLTLMTALEVLAEPKLLPLEYQVAISTLKKHAEGVTADSVVLQHLKGGLGRMKRQSLTQACVDLVTAGIGDSAGAEMSQLYDLRSRIIHRGVGISADEINRQSSRLLEIVTSALLADVRNSANAVTKRTQGA